MDLQRKKNIIAEKYRFLFMNHFGDTFELDTFLCDELIFNEETGAVEEFDLHIEADAHLPCDGEARDWANLIQNIDYKILRFLYDTPMDPKTLKVVQSDFTHRISEGFFYKFILKVDELHKFGVIYRILYHE